MSRRVNKYKHHLKFLSVCDHKTCKQLIGKADKELINCICECALNILKGSVPLIIIIIISLFTQNNTCIAVLQW